MKLITAFRNAKPNTRILSLVSLLNDIASESIARILPLFLKEVLKTSYSAIGLTEGIADSLSILLRLGSGWISDVFNRKKPLVAIGYSISAITRPFFPVAIAIFGWPGALFLKTADRVGKAMRVAPRDALIASESPKDKHGDSFGLNRAMDTFGAFLGVGIAMAVIALQPDANNSIISPQTFKIAIYTASSFGFLAAGLVIFRVKEDRSNHLFQDAKTQSSKTTISQLSPQLWKYLFCVGLFCLAGSSDAFLLLKLRESGFTLLETLALIMGYNLVAAASAHPIAQASDRFKSRKYPLLAGWLIYAIAYALFAYSESTIVLGFGFVFYGLYYGFVEATEKAFVADFVPKTHLGRAYGILNFVMGLMLLPANLIFGYVSDHYNMNVAFNISAVIAVFSCILLAGLSMKLKQSHSA